MVENRKGVGTTVMTKRKQTEPVASDHQIIPAEHIDHAILIFRGYTVLLDAQPAVFYGAEVRTLVQTVKRNSDRFPEDFMFQLTEKEWEVLKMVEAERIEAGIRSQNVIIKTERGQLRTYNNKMAFECLRTI